MSEFPLLRVEGVVRDVRVGRRQWRRILDGVSLVVPAGGAVGLVGESGSGKSTLARCILGLDRPQAGRVLIDGSDILLAPLCGRVQAVFQDPHGSLDPRMTVAEIVAEPLLPLRPRPARAERRQRVAAMLAAVGLDLDAAARYPHAFSGGQRQRIALARALVSGPRLVVADEPVSALDVSVQAQVLALIRDLRQRLGVAWLFISHDLAVVRLVTDSVAVLQAGRIVEQGATASVLRHPSHPYTQALVAAMPRPIAAMGRS